MEEQTDLLRAEREDIEKREILQDVMEEISLFNLRLDEEQQSDSGPSTTIPMNDYSDFPNVHFHPLGIKFFDGSVNNIYNQDLIEPNLNLKWLQFDKLGDPLELLTIEKLIRYECILQEFCQKKAVFKFFFKLLFTEQTECVLYSITCILIAVITRTQRTDSLLKVTLEAIPSGIQNLGGRGDLVYPAEVLSRNERRKTKEHQEMDYNPIPNVKYVLNVLKRLVTKERSMSKEEIDVSNSDIDNLLFLFLCISHHPTIVRSSIIPVIQDFLAIGLDLYPSDSEYPEKVQELVERIGIYWDDSETGFDHHTAYFVTCNIFPFSIRGRQIKTCLAYYALQCSLTPTDCEIVDVMHLSRLSKFCNDNVDAIKDVNFYTLYSVFKFVDAAIDRPVNSDNDKEELGRILETMSTVQMSKAYGNDLYNKTKLLAFIKEITEAWERMLEKEKKIRKQFPFSTVTEIRK